MKFGHEIRIKDWFHSQKGNGDIDGNGTFYFFAPDGDRTCDPDVPKKEGESPVA